MTLTDSQRKTAREQAVVFTTYCDWVDELEADPPAPTMFPTGPSAYPEHAYLFDASPEQQADPSQRVRDALAKVREAA
jgi:hypothetical protein